MVNNKIKLLWIRNRKSRSWKMIELSFLQTSMSCLRVLTRWDVGVPFIPSVTVTIPSRNSFKSQKSSPEEQVALSACKLRRSQQKIDKSGLNYHFKRSSLWFQIDQTSLGRQHCIPFGKNFENYFKMPYSKHNCELFANAISNENCSLLPYYGVPGGRLLTFFFLKYILPLKFYLILLIKWQTNDRVNPKISFPWIYLSRTKMLDFLSKRRLSLVCLFVLGTTNTKTHWDNEVLFSQHCFRTMYLVEDEVGRTDVGAIERYSTIANVDFGDPE